MSHPNFLSPDKNPIQRRRFPVENRPRILRDCLLEDSNSCSSSGFKSFPRRLPAQRSTNAHPVQMNLNTTTKPGPESKAKASKPQGVLRSRSLRAVINALKSLNFSVLKSPTLLPRSISRRLSKKGSNLSSCSLKKESEVRYTVTVKDIMRWRSFRDLDQEKRAPRDPDLSPPHHCTTATTVTTTTSGSTTCSSNSSSWCDSDFTSEYLPSFDGENDTECKNYSPGVGDDSMEAVTGSAADTEVGPKGLQSNDEKEFNSPVSVLGIHYEEDEEESVYCSSASMGHVETGTKKRLMQKIKHFETLAEVDSVDLEKRMSRKEGGDEEQTTEIEKKVVQLWDLVNEACPLWNHKEYYHIELLLMDYFRDELLMKTNSHNDQRKLEWDLVAEANTWVNGGIWPVAEWGSTEQKRKACVQDIERESGPWIKFLEEQEEVAVDIESEVTGYLVEELVAELYSY